MKKVFGWIGFFIGWFLALYFCGDGNNKAALLLMPLGVILGRFIGKNIDESREQERINREKLDREMREFQQRLARGLYLVKNYPEATKEAYTASTGKDLPITSQENPSDDVISIILSHSEQYYQQQEEKLNKAYRAKKEAERLELARKREEERLAAERKRVAEQLEQKRKEDEKRRAISILPSCVENWSSHSNSTLKHKYYYDYYPYALNKDDATSSMWYTWKIVWHFKNDPDKSISSEDHEYALRVVIRKVEDTLRSTFGTSTEYLTLVCMTASTQRKTEMRFREFAETVCKDLKMTNAYPFINVKEGGSAKHEGGDGAQEISLDRGFFNGKYVVLFDDVRTTGRSLETMRSNLERLGAKVLCAITIAQTTH